MIIFCLFQIHQCFSAISTMGRRRSTLTYHAARRKEKEYRQSLRQQREENETADGEGEAKRQDNSLRKSQRLLQKRQQEDDEYEPTPHSSKRSLRGDLPQSDHTYCSAAPAPYHRDWDPTDPQEGTSSGRSQSTRSRYISYK